MYTHALNASPEEHFAAYTIQGLYRARMQVSYRSSVGYRWGGNKKIEHPSHPLMSLWSTPPTARVHDLPATDS